MHNWNGDQSVETTVESALLDFTGSSEGKPLCEYIDLKAVTEALGSEASGRGASEVRFDYEKSEIRILQDGTITARNRPAT